MFRDDGVILVVCEQNKRFPPLDTVHPSGRGIKNRFLIFFSISQFTSIFGFNWECESSREREWEKEWKWNLNYAVYLFFAAADIQSITNIFTFQWFIPMILMSYNFLFFFCIQHFRFNSHEFFAPMNIFLSKVLFSFRNSKYKSTVHDLISDEIGNEQRKTEKKIVDIYPNSYSNCR